jgi:histidyl-tRNA synthetase
MRHADKLGASSVIIIGDDEVTSGRLTVRDMRAKVDHRQIAPLDVSTAGLRALLDERSASRMERHG